MKSFLVSKRNNAIVYRILNITPTTGYLRNDILHVHPGGWDDIAFHIYIFPFKMLEDLPLPTHAGWIDTAQEVLLPFPSTPLNMCSMHGKHIPDGRVMVILDDTQKQG